MDEKRFSFDRCRPQTEHFSEDDMFDSLDVLMGVVIGDDDDYKKMSKRLYKTFKKQNLN